jgi:NAD(P)-dependent dehydrogenase (short-subunit alcohol dehydrogenase family)
VIATARGDARARLKSLAEAGCEALSLDVTAPLEQLRASIEDVIQRHGRIDVLVNNAGMVQQGAVEETTFGILASISSKIDPFRPEETQEQFNVNLFGLLNLTRLVLPHMRSQQSGVIVNIGSRGGRFGIPAVGLYNTTKFALEGWSLSSSLRPALDNLTMLQ